MRKKENIPESALNIITAVLQEPKNCFAEHVSPAMALWRCMEFISINLKIALKENPEYLTNATIDDQLKSICRASSLQFRTIELSENWWKQDIGPVLAFYESYDHPAAVIPESFDRYLLIVPSKNLKLTLTKSLAKKLLTHAVMFYCVFPNKLLSWRDIAKFCFTNMRVDGIRVFLIQIMVVLLGFFIPIATGILFEQVIPNTAYSLLWQFTIGLTVNVFVVTIFTIVLVISITRIRLKTTASLQAAIWDRLMRLPISFFRQFTAGDLTLRASGIDSIQRMITSSVFVSLSSGILSLLSLIIMFYYSVALTIGVLVLVVIVALVTLFANLRQLRYLKADLFLHGKLTGFILQFITSITKIKMTNSAGRVFLKWSKIFSDKSRMFYNSGKIIAGMAVFNAVFSVISTIALFSMVFAAGDQLSFGSFITFNAAFAQFFVAILSMTGVITSILTIVPLYARIKPILETQPENQYGINPGILSGKVDLTHVSFRYSDETPVVFKDLNITVNPGELVAFVGASGCGKSTLFRLLLGIEQPQAGKIYYSDLELSNLNISEVRRQISVVLQDSVLFPGTILENIVGTAAQYDLEEVEKLIQNVGLAEELNAMPMRLQTVVAEQGKTFSGGQRQRLLLARALFKKPKLLLLDEATSALDNFTQERIYRYLASLEMTCLVIAHRPSTLKFADRIYVVHNGTIAETSSDKELLNKNGVNDGT